MAPGLCDNPKSTTSDSRARDIEKLQVCEVLTGRGLTKEQMTNDILSR